MYYLFGLLLGAIIQLGKGATLWFNQPTASQLRLKYQVW